MLLQEKLKDIRIILGSQSPRRKELLASMDLDFTVEVKETDESFDANASAVAIVRAIAEAN